MANANHKSRPPVTERFVAGQESARHHFLSRVPVLSERTGN